MTGRKITVTAAPDGSVIVRVDGVKGRACRGLTAPFLAALGTVTEDRSTAEGREECPPERLKVGGSL